MMKKFFQNFLRKTEGISALEYALIAGLVALAIIIGAGTLGGSMNTQFENAATEVDNAPNTVP